MHTAPWGLAGGNLRHVAVEAAHEKHRATLIPILVLGPIGIASLPLDVRCYLLHSPLECQPPKKLRHPDPMLLLLSTSTISANFRHTKITQ
jgi:hypothetical protein